jgi:hypothetical protein
MIILYLHIMDAYKVSFFDNIAISAQRVTSYIESVKMGVACGRKFIKWLIIYAANEKESIDKANGIVKNFFRFLYL